MNNKIKYRNVKATVLAAYESGMDVAIHIANGIYLPNGVNISEAVGESLGDHFILKLNDRSLGRPLSFDDEALTLDVVTRIKGVSIQLDVHVDAINIVYLGDLSSDKVDTIYYAGFLRHHLDVQNEEIVVVNRPTDNKPKLSIIK